MTRKSASYGTSDPSTESRVNSNQIIDQEVRGGVKGGLVCEEKYIY